MISLIILCFATLAAGKIYERCELARELKYVHGVPDHQLATWVCIAEHESAYNSSIVGHLSVDGSLDHGLFQINDKYWCSPPGKGYACGLTCAQLEDDDISDDYNCAQEIYKEHKTLSGDGFNAWAVYQPHCKGPKADKYIKGCFNDVDSPKVTSDLTPTFPHRFFGTTTGRTNKGFYSTSTKRPSTFDAFFTPPSSTSFFNSPSSGPTFYSSTTNSPFSFFQSSFKPTISRFMFSDPTTSRTTFLPLSGRSNFIDSSSSFSTPSTSRFSAFFPLSGRSTFTDSSSSFSSPSTSRFPFFSSTTSRTVYQQNNAANSIVNEPVFIFNGVKWY